MTQLAMSLPRLDASGRDDFMISPSNATAVALLDGWPDWPDRRLALVGPEGAGKSHLAAIWAGEVGATCLRGADLSARRTPDLATGPLVVEDVDRGVPEEALFHLWNACAQAGHGLLLTGRGMPAAWPLDLPDLRSRVSSLTPAVIGDPDDMLLSRPAAQALRGPSAEGEAGSDRLPAAPDGAQFRRAARMVATLDAEALARCVPVNQALARTLFE